jgi:hypothetical protein
LRGLRRLLRRGRPLIEQGAQGEPRARDQ